MGDDRPLFSTFKPTGEATPAGATAGPRTGAEQPPGHAAAQDTGVRRVCPPTSAPTPHPQGARASSGVLRPLAPSLQVPPGSWPSPPGDPRPELVALRARTTLWFEQTQARRLGAGGELPAWFHGFISRR